MLLNDLFEALSDEDVAAIMAGPSIVPKSKSKYDPLSPGGKRALQVQIDTLEEKYQELKRYHTQIKQFMSKIPPGLEQDLLSLEKQYKAAIEIETAALKDAFNQTKTYKLLDGIKNKCSDAVAAMQSTGRVLYRGTSYTQDIYIGKPFTDRRTTTSHQKIQEVYDNAIAKEGFKALRSNSIFTSTSREFATGFGNHLYIIFPVNGFDFTWSKTIKDIIIKTRHVANWLDNNIVTALWDKIFTNDAAKNRFLELVDMDQSDGDPDDGNIPYVYKKAYILESDGFFGSSRLATDLKAMQQLAAEGLIEGVPTEMSELVSSEKVVKNMNLSHENFAAALNSGHEICIHGTYYAISHKYLPLIKTVLKID